MRPTPRSMRISPRPGTPMGDAVRQVAQLAADTLDFIAEQAEPYEDGQPTAEEIAAADRALQMLQAQLVDAQSQILVARSRLAHRTARAA